MRPPRSLNLISRFFWGGGQRRPLQITMSIFHSCLSIIHIISIVNSPSAFNSQEHFCYVFIGQQRIFLFVFYLHNDMSRIPHSKLYDCILRHQSVIDKVGTTDRFLFRSEATLHIVELCLSGPTYVSRRLLLFDGIIFFLYKIQKNMQINLYYKK